jgi:hypothetical protein
LSWANSNELIGLPSSRRFPESHRSTSTLENRLAFFRDEPVSRDQLLDPSGMRESMQGARHEHSHLVLCLVAVGLPEEETKDGLTSMNQTQPEYIFIPAFHGPQSFHLLLSLWRLRNQPGNGR